MQFIIKPSGFILENAKPHPTKLDEYDSLYEVVEASLSQELTIPKDVMDSFRIKDTLNPEIWPKGKLDEKVKNQLMKIARAFMKDIGIPKGTKIKDIIFTGSLANYNWSRFSDIDLHIVLDLNKFTGNPQMIRDFFTAQKTLWNNQHDIKIKGYPVELYVQDTNEKLHATAIYSIARDKWIKKPIREKLRVDKQTIKNKAKQFISKLRNIRDAYKDHKYQQVIDDSTKLKDKIKQMRKAGLESGGEYSIENLVFKVLRRTAFMDLLSDLKAKAYDKLMTISEQDLNEGEVLNNTEFRVDKGHEDDYYISAKYNGDEIGVLVIYEVVNGYWMFDDVLSEDEYEEIFPDDEFIDFNYLNIPDANMRGEGIAKKLVSLGIEEAKKLGYTTIYLNASPMGGNGLPLNDLVGFYKSFGFNEFKHQGNNVLMVKYI